ncbi:ribbon-helix-helix domain-containing protein [Xanthobacter autotrophicus]|uniref:ribbon-helix-helix domain-containing protein n=1 Tax=Xanthobacter TaxID=279 RepID=UPI0024AB526D|nr:ribbon-helix-helix domain-containing protein [Xanthobacter autotrophicus]MDI4662820.1 ribbon-helix-helix domain-containing protein [Xanthobacter autotrophicus]
MCRLFSGADPALWIQETRALRLNGFSTSVRLEAFFWSVLEDIAARDGLSVNRLLSRLHDEKAEAGRDIENFTSFLRVCCGRYLALRAQGLVPEEGALAALDATAVLHAERDAPLLGRRASSAA